MTLIQKLIYRFKKLLFGEEFEDNKEKIEDEFIPLDEKEKQSKTNIEGGSYVPKNRENALQFADEINNDDWLTGNSG